MRRSTLVIITLTLCLAIVPAWSQSSGGNATATNTAAGTPATAPQTANTMPNAQPIAPSQPTPNQPMQNNNGLIQSGGFVSSGPQAAPMIVTPSVSLNVVSTHPVGATSGTGNNVVGASSSTLNALPATVEGMVTTQAQISNPNLMSVNTTIENATNAAVLEAINQSRSVNLGIGNPLAGSAYAFRGGSSNQDLGAVSREYRARRNPNAHVYTNDDIARLNQSGANTGVSVLGTDNTNAALPTGGVSGATNVAPSASNTQQQPAVAAPAQTVPGIDPRMTDHTPPRKPSPFGPPTQEVQPVPPARPPQ